MGERYYCDCGWVGEAPVPVDDRTLFFERRCATCGEQTASRIH